MVADEDEGQVRVCQQALFHKVGILGVQRTRAFVHQQDGTLVNERTGDGDALLLSAGDVAALFPDDGIQPVRHPRQIPRQCAVLHCLLQLLLRELLAQRDVLPDGGVEQEYILLDIAHLLLQLFRRNGADVGFIQRNVPRIIGQPTQQKFQQCRLSAAGRPGQRIFFPFFKPEGYIFQNRLFAVAEGKIFDRDGVCKRPQRLLLRLPVLHMAGDLGKIRSACRKGHRQLRDLIQSVIHACTDISGSHKGCQRDPAMENQHAKEHRNRYLTKRAHISQPIADAILRHIQFVARRLDLIAGTIDPCGESGILPKKAQNIVACQQVFDFADSIRLICRTFCTHLPQLLVEQSWYKDHDDGDHKRRRQQQPMDRRQCSDAAGHLCSRSDQNKKRRPCQLIDLIDIVRKLGEIFSALKFVILLMCFAQQPDRHIPAQGVIDLPDGAPLKNGFADQTQHNHKPYGQRQHDFQQKHFQISVQQRLHDLDLQQTRVHLQTIRQNHERGGRRSWLPEFFEVIFHNAFPSFPILSFGAYILSYKSLADHIVSCYKKKQNDIIHPIFPPSSLESPILLCYTTTIKPERRYPSCKISFLESLSASAGWILG